jgi:hypothetical protein
MIVASTIVPPLTCNPRDALRQVVPFQQMTEVQDRRLVRNPLAPEIDADELAHGDRVIQRLLGGRTRQVEPMLQEVQS